MARELGVDVGAAFPPRVLGDGERFGDERERLGEEPRVAGVGGGHPSQRADQRRTGERARDCAGLGEADGADPGAGRRGEGVEGLVFAERRERVEDDLAAHLMKGEQVAVDEGLGRLRIFGDDHGELHLVSSAARKRPH